MIFYYIIKNITFSFVLKNMNEKVIRLEIIKKNNI